MALQRSFAIIEFDTKGTILTANENFCAVMGYSLDEIRGHHHRMFVEPEFASSAEYAAFWRKLQDGEFVASEFKRIGRNGKIVWLQVSYNPIFDHKGRVIKVVKFATNMTGRVGAIDAIAEGLNKLVSNMLSYRLDTSYRF